MNSRIRWFSKREIPVTLPIACSAAWVNDVRARAVTCQPSSALSCTDGAGDQREFSQFRESFHNGTTFFFLSPETAGCIDTSLWGDESPTPQHSIALLIWSTSPLKSFRLSYIRRCFKYCHHASCLLFFPSLPCTLLHILACNNHLFLRSTHHS